VGQINEEVAVELDEEEQTPKYRHRSRLGMAMAMTAASPDTEPHHVLGIYQIGIPAT
jgi:hypothetical protein